MFRLLNSLCKVHSPSGEEVYMKQFILSYVQANAKYWRSQPQIFHGDLFQDCVVLVFGTPRTAAFAHMDTTGFTVRYQNQLIPIGSPEVQGGEQLTGRDELGEIACGLELHDDGHCYHRFGRAISPGTSLAFKNSFVENDTFIISPYLDNRVGMFNLLKVAETIAHGALVFSCWEEHGGGSVPYLVKFLYENFGISKMLISDITWISDGIDFDEGVVISNRDRNIPRRSFVQHITRVAMQHGIRFQQEVEAHGSSDGREIQISPYPIDWCFVGPPIADAHSDHESVAKKDIHSTIELYKVLMAQL
ncbi:MAG: aminopeptidase [Cyclobacteriaceae bacterium]|nr:aminopeptidase [Cyclobacteriaceae bacterium]